MKKNEYGRSMVEMLGVLAIVGVLSVMGILGYRIAMRRYQANEIANTAVTLMVMAHAANSGEGGCKQLSKSNLSEYPGGVHVDIVADTVAGGGLAVKLMDSDDEALCAAVADLLGGTEEYDQCETKTGTDVSCGPEG